jgi:tetratricopeptide (TPR) repeat protein
VATFGERLREMRRDLGLTQGELAGEELSASYVSLLEADKRTPSDEVLHLLAARLSCSIVQLVEGRPSDRDQLMQLELSYAKLAIEHGESSDARERLERLIAEDGLPLRVHDEASLLLGTALQRLGLSKEAVRLLCPLLERASAGQAFSSVVDVGQVLCRSYLEASDLHRAVQAGERALAAARSQHLNESNDYFRLAATVVLAHLNLGDVVHARTWADSLIAEAEAAGQVAGQAALYWNSAVAAELEGDPDEALRLCDKALARLSELDNLRDYARIRYSMAELLLTFDSPDVDRAKGLLSRCLADLQDHGSRVDHSAWNRAMSLVLLHQGDLSGAEGRARQAFDLVDENAVEARALALMSLWDTVSAQGRNDEALDYLHRAVATLGDTGGRMGGLLWRELAERLNDASDVSSAVVAYQRALDSVGLRDRSVGARTAVQQLRKSRRMSNELL